MNWTIVFGSFLLGCCLLAFHAEARAAGVPESSLDPVQELLRTLVTPQEAENSGFKCVGNECGRCEELHVPEVKLKDTTCINMTYLPEEYGIRLTATVGKDTVLNKTVSIKKPHPVCHDIDYFEKGASICVDVYDFNTKNESLNGCVKMEIRLFHLTVYHKKIGCFDFPLRRNELQAEEVPEISLDDVQRLLNDLVSPQNTDNSGCNCVDFNCGCCLGIHKLKGSTCVNISYLPEDYGVSLTVSVGKYTLLNETASAKNPPPVCVGIPYIKREASICVDFYDLDIKNKTFSGCLKMQLHLLHVNIFQQKVGCVSFPLHRKKSIDTLMWKNLEINH